jgi:hypothetical protein
MAAAGSHLLTDDNEPRSVAAAGLELAGDLRVDAVDCGHHGEPCLDRPLCVVLVYVGIAKIGQHPVAQILGDEAVKSSHGIRDAPAVDGDQVAHILGVEPGRETRRTDEIAKHHS